MRTQLSPLIVEQAADWFSRFLTGEIPLSEREKFLRWLQQSPEHVQVYLEEACMHPAIAPSTLCERLTHHVDELCSTVRADGSRDGSRRRKHKRR